MKQFRYKVMLICCALAGCGVLGFMLAVWYRSSSSAEDEPACGIAVSDKPDDQMVFIPGGTLHLGWGAQRPEERPIVDISVGDFWISRHDVTVSQFARFVRETGYQTVAERAASTSLNVAYKSHTLRQGGAVFHMPTQRGWTALIGSWELSPDADWRHPDGKGSDIAGKEWHPVVQIAFEDALAYAHWAGLDLPTEAQWEYAAQSGAGNQPSSSMPGRGTDSQLLANTWQGPFPFANTKLDGFSRTSPVGCFPANGYGLYDMVGNVWQWTKDWYFPTHRFDSTQRRPWNQQHSTEAVQSFDPDNPDVPSRVIKGGSFLCAPNFCARARPAARQPHEAALGTNHLGFRVVRSSAEETQK
jgi:formylglycine-generating enzyme required for sulfatase activity